MNGPFWYDVKHGTYIPKTCTAVQIVTEMELGDWLNRKSKEIAVKSHLITI